MRLHSSSPARHSIHMKSRLSRSRLQTSRRHTYKAIHCPFFAFGTATQTQLHPRAQWKGRSLFLRRYAKCCALFLYIAGCLHEHTSTQDASVR
ncbi:hypothetical protein DAEQUDRAFT_376393 [Daedalea quercina L-15889]|uniref:Uncharacterized protein n=1 Tax=Daedalea quercina L-15889 TaxID=1314783 RepID=A0A165P8I1_9APHY|nr:hypothetical protein DAEQUDRAFT_376393 [Daedalea quercina L-15889]